MQKLRRTVQKYRLLLCGISIALGIFLIMLGSMRFHDITENSRSAIELSQITVKAVTK